MAKKKQEKPTDPQEAAKVFKDIGGIMANPPKLYEVNMKGNAEEGKKADPITKGQRINAIEEIKNAFQKEPKRLTIADLDLENQDWENEINRTEKIMEIEKIKWWVLADIEKKRHQKIPTKHLPIENKNKFPVNWIVGGVVIIAIAILGMLILYEKKRGLKIKR